MKQHDLIQGSDSWHAHRLQSLNASDAPAALGCSPYTSRAELLHRMHTGLTPEVDAATQRLFDSGHRAEGLARPLAEEIIGEDLAPLVGSIEVPGLSRPLSASFDGITLMGDTLFEHKHANAALRACMKDQGNGYDLPKHYRVQCEQQLLVAGAERVLFMASEWTGDGTLVEERHCWYASDPDLRRELLAGWAQFEQDLAAYVPPAGAAPAPVGRAPEALPALRIEVTGMVTASNLGAFREHAMAVFKGINRTLTTDEHFANAERTVKWCAEAEERLKAAKQHALSQTESIDALFRAIDEISGEARAVRLELDKLVKAEKERRRGEIVAGAIGALQQHVAGLNASLGKPLMPAIPADFGGAIKGLRSLASMEEAVGNTLARAKIAAGEAFQRIHANLNTLRQYDEHKRLFPDVAAIVQKAPEDLQALVSSRIAAEERRLEAERERIRAEEQARAEREAQARAASEARQREQQEAAERRQREQEAAAAARAELQAAQQKAEGAELSPAAQALNEQEGAARFAAKHPGAAPAANVVPMPAKPAAAPRILTLGAVCQRVGFTMSASFVCETLGVSGERVKAATMFSEPEFDEICARLIHRVEKVRQQHLQRAA